jgi:hypothetical protein
VSEHDETITPDDFDLMAWIVSGTVATRTVEIHNNPALAEEFDALEAEMKAAERDVAALGEDRPMSWTDPRPEIEDRMAELWERWEASKTTWTVRALSHDEIEATFDAVPSPKQPVAPLPAAGKKAAEDHAEKMSKWARALHEADRERTLHIIAAAVTSVESVRGRADSVTVEALRALRDRPHGDAWVGHIPSTKGARMSGKLASAVMAATEGDVAVPRPTSPVRSTTTPA